MNVTIIEKMLNNTSLLDALRHLALNNVQLFILIAKQKQDLISMLFTKVTSESSESIDLICLWADLTICYQDEFP